MSNEKCDKHKKFKTSLKDWCILNDKLELLEEYCEDNELITDNIGYASEKYVKWRCNTCGAEWEAQPKNRTLNSSGCPKCNKRGTSFPEQAIYYYLSKIYPDTINTYRDIFKNNMELDVYIPSFNLGIEYDGKFSHNSKETYKNEKIKYEICKANNIKLIRIKENKKHRKNQYCDKLFFSDYESNNYDKLDICITKLFNYLNIDSNNIDTKKDVNEIKILYKKKRKQNSLAVTHSDVSAQWHPTKNGMLTPDMFTHASHDKVWFKCQSCGNDYQARIIDRVREKHGCPICSRKAISKSNSKKVAQYDKKGNFIAKFPSATMAAQSLGVKSSMVSRVCAGTRSSSYGYIWKYIDENNVESHENIKNNDYLSKINNKLKDYETERKVGKNSEYSNIYVNLLCNINFGYNSYRMWY